MTRHQVEVPEPQFFRHKEHCSRKFTRQEKKTHSFYHIVPRFFDFYHPTTTWLINVIKSENEKELNRVLMDKETKGLLKFEPDPRAIQVKKTVISGKKDFIITKAKYFQILDRPDFYAAKDFRAPLFNRHAVMYLTPLGLAIYLRKPKAARILVQCVDRDTNKKHIQARQPQFITFINERFGDLMCMYDHNLAILNETYDILQWMLMNDNWFPMESHKMVYRKRFVETYQSFDDFLDYAFYVMFTKRSSLNIPGLVAVVIKAPTEHFRANYMSQPSRANKMTLLRDADRVINNCKTYPRRLLRCAFYADKRMKSTMNLICAANSFINLGIFKLVNEPSMPFASKPGYRKRLETIPSYRERSRGIRVEWPNAYYEFDADCCIALLVGIIAKCYRLAKKPTFDIAIRAAVKILAEAGWLNYFDIISDLEFKDYFMGLDDAEKVRCQPEVFAFVRECTRITVIEGRFELANFFSEERLDREIRALHDVRDHEVLTKMLMCSDENIVRYVTLEKGEELNPAGTVIGGNRVRDKGRNDPKNKYYTDKLEFPRESTKTVVTNTANTESSGGGGAAETSSSSNNDNDIEDDEEDETEEEEDEEAPETENRSNVKVGAAGNCDLADSSDDAWRQDLREFLVDAEVVRDRPRRQRALKLLHSTTHSSRSHQLSAPSIVPTLAPLDLMPNLPQLVQQVPQPSRPVRSGYSRGGSLLPVPTKKCLPRVGPPRRK